MKLCFNLGYFGLSLYSILQFVLQPFNASSDGALSFIVLSTTLVCMLVYCAYFSLKSYRATRVLSFTRAWLLFLLLYFSYYIAGLIGLPTDLSYQSPRELAVAIFLFVSLLFSYYGVVTGAFTKEKLMLFLVLIFFSGVSEVYFSTIDPRERPGGVLEINTSHGYIFAMILPVLLYKYRLQTIWLLALTLVLTMMTGKRGGVVVVLLLVIYCLSSFKVFYKNYTLSLKEVALLGGTIVAAFFFLQYSLDSFLYRIDNIQNERTGQLASGRDILWSQFIEGWYSSDLLNFFFGHGYYSTVNYNGFVAHNDYIQYLFDFGLLGLALYVYMLCVMYKNIKDIKSSNRLLYICLMLCFLVLISRGAISGTVRTDQFILFIAMGYLLGLFVKEKFYRYGEA